MITDIPELTDSQILQLYEINLKSIDACYRIIGRTPDSANFIERLEDLEKEQQALTDEYFLRNPQERKTV